MKYTEAGEIWKFQIYEPKPCTNIVVSDTQNILEEFLFIFELLQLFIYYLAMHI